MNRKIGVTAALINVAAVAGFALSMALNSMEASYITSMLIALSFIPMMSLFAQYAGDDRKGAGSAAVAFAAVYATLVLVVYFTQMTAVRTDVLNEQALSILNYQRFGLFFSYDLLGYGMMALATFFAGLSFRAQNRQERWLKGLLLVHGVFFPCCMVMPMLGVFRAGSPDMAWLGTALLMFWCGYFLPVGILSALYFKRRA